jgi:hypothetical protein
VLGLDFDLLLDGLLYGWRGGGELVFDMAALGADLLDLAHSWAGDHGLGLVQGATAVAASFFAFKHKKGGVRGLWQMGADASTAGMKGN